MRRFLSNSTEQESGLRPRNGGYRKRKSLKYTIESSSNLSSVTYGYCAQSRYTRPTYERLAASVAEVSGGLGMSSKSERSSSPVRESMSEFAKKSFVSATVCH